MRAKSRASKMRQDNDYTMSSPTNAMQLSLPLFVTVESVPQNRETTWQDKSNLCFNSIPPPKSSKISATDSTSKDKDCNPYWSDLCEAISSRLLLPVKTDCVTISHGDATRTDFNYSSSWHNKTVDKSWFSTSLFTVEKQNLQQIFSPSFMSKRFAQASPTVAECTDSEVTARRSRKIRLFLNLEQRMLLKQWFGLSRYVYNKTIEYLQEPDTQAKWMKVAPIILGNLPQWAKPVPYQIKKIAVRDACVAVRAAKKGFGKDGQIRQCKFRSRKDKKQTIFVPKSAIKDSGVYYTILGKSILKEALPKNFSDGRLTLVYGEYYLIVSEEVQPQQTEKQGSVVALDPGVRTFMTFFSESSFGWLGSEANLRIQKLCFKLDKIISKISKSSCKEKQRLKKAADRFRAKIRHLVDELHHKVARFLVDNFDVILLPSFESSHMVSKSCRKLRSKSVRQMLTLSHYRFKKYLEWKARETGKIALTNINEAYTSKTVSWTGEVINIGGSRTIKSKIDGNQMDRDLNGARGIFLRALVDTPLLRDNLNLCIC